MALRTCVDTKQKMSREHRPTIRICNRFKPLNLLPAQNNRSRLRTELDVKLSGYKFIQELIRSHSLEKYEDGLLHWLARFLDHLLYCLF